MMRVQPYDGERSRRRPRFVVEKTVRPLHTIALDTKRELRLSR